MQYMAIMEASPWWWALRRGPQGQHIIRDLLRQMLSALAVLQAANITHRYRPAFMKHQPRAANITHSYQAGLESSSLGLLLFTMLRLLS